MAMHPAMAGAPPEPPRRKGGAAGQGRPLPASLAWFVGVWVFFQRLLNRGLRTTVRVKKRSRLHRTRAHHAAPRSRGRRRELCGAVSRISSPPEGGAPMPAGGGGAPCCTAARPAAAGGRAAPSAPSAAAAAAARTAAASGRRASSSKMLSPSIIASSTPPKAAEAAVAARHPPRAASTPPVSAPDAIEFHEVLLPADGDGEQSKVEKRPPHTAKLPPTTGARALDALDAPDQPLAARRVARAGARVPHPAADRAHRERAAEVVEDAVRAGSRSWTDILLQGVRASFEASDRRRLLRRRCSEHGDGDGDVRELRRQEAARARARAPRRAARRRRRTRPGGRPAAEAL